MAWARALVAIGAAVAVGLALVSGGSGADPRTPAALPGAPVPFLGTAVAGSGEATAAVDAYGSVVDLRAGPAGPALIENPADRQAAGTVPAATGIVPRVAIGDGPALPPWRADVVEQRYLSGTNVVRTVARFGGVSSTVTVAAFGRYLGMVVDVDAPATVADSGAEVQTTPSLRVNVEAGAECETEQRLGRAALICRLPDEGSPPGGGRIDSLAGSVEPESVLEQAGATIQLAAADDREWVGRARPLGAGAPTWAVEAYERSLLALRALTDRRTGAVAAGARDGWTYVWPRDAGAAVLALAAAGYRQEARLATRFLLGLGIEQAARFHGDGSPVEGRAAQGDAAGWVAVAAEAAGLIGNARHAARILTQSHPAPWRDRADYREGDPGDFLANAIASTPPGDRAAPFGRHTPKRNGALEGRNLAASFATPRGLVRSADDPDAGLDSAAAWAVRPFPHPGLFATARRTLLRLEADGTRFGILPGTDWHGGADPWSAPTAWSAWSLAALGERAAALRLLADLRRAATPAGALPERVDLATGVPRSTTPLAWSHAFTALALRELWP